MSVSSRILVVDDQESNVDMLSRRLQRVGYEVVSALSGQEALKALQSEPIDLVLLDQMMPGMTGIEVLQTVRATKELQQIPVIMVTAVNDGAAIAEALDAGAMTTSRSRWSFRPRWLGSALTWRVDELTAG